MGDELKWLLNKEVGVFSRLVILLSADTPTAFAYAITVNGVCLHFLVPPLAQCGFFRVSCLDITAYLIRWVSFGEKSTLCNSFIQKRGVVLFRG